MAIFTITTADGVEHTGIPMGNGGALGAGSAHRGREHEIGAAIRQLDVLIRSKKTVVMLPLTDGNVPFEVMKRYIKVVSLVNTTARQREWADVRHLALKGPPYPQLD